MRNLVYLVNKQDGALGGLDCLQEWSGHEELSRHDFFPDHAPVPIRILIHQDVQLLHGAVVIADGLFIGDAVIALQSDEGHATGARKRNRQLRLAGAGRALLENGPFECRGVEDGVRGH